MPRFIVVKIAKATAAVTVEAVGFNGAGCRDATKELENALGVVTSRDTKPVMWNALGVDRQRTVTNGQV